MNSWLKYGFVVINILFLIVGALCIGFALWAESVPLVSDVITDLNLSDEIYYFGTIVGSILTIVGLFGTIGALYEKKGILIVYILIVISFIASELWAIIYSVVQGGDVIINKLSVVWTSLSNDTKFLVQEGFQCCGYDSATEWGGEYPTSCIDTTVANSTTPWSKPCSDSILNWIRSNILVCGGALAALVLFQIMQIVITGLLIRNIVKSNRVEVDANVKIYESQPAVPSHENEAYYDDDDDNFYSDPRPYKIKTKTKEQQPTTSTNW